MARRNGSMRVPYVHGIGTSFRRKVGCDGQHARIKDVHGTLPGSSWLPCVLAICEIIRSLALNRVLFRLILSRQDSSIEAVTY